MEKSKLTRSGESLKERLKEFFMNEGFDKTEINLLFNGDDERGNRIVNFSIKAIAEPYSNKNK